MVRIRTGTTNQYESTRKNATLRVFSCDFAVILFLILFYTLPALAQNLPKEIRGYKVHKTNISVKTSGAKRPQGPAPKPS